MDHSLFDVLENITDDDEVISEMKKLIEKGADVNALHDDEFTLLMYTPSTVVAQFLIDNGLDVDTVDSFGESALFRAALDMTKVLLENGANPNIRNEDGQTVLIHCADGEDENEKCELLLAAGANIDLTDDREKTAFDVALESSNYTLVDKLLEAGARVPEGSEQFDVMLMDFETFVLEYRELSDKIRKAHDTNTENEERCHELESKIELIKRIIERIVERTDSIEIIRLFALRACRMI